VIMLQKMPRVGVHECELECGLCVVKNRRSRTRWFVIAAYVRVVTERSIGTAVKKLCACARV
jgi:hypothetical protein